MKNTILYLSLCITLCSNMLNAMELKTDAEKLQAAKFSQALYEPLKQKSDADVHILDNLVKADAKNYFAYVRERGKNLLQPLPQNAEEVRAALVKTEAYFMDRIAKIDQTQSLQYLPYGAQDTKFFGVNAQEDQGVVKSAVQRVAQLYDQNTHVFGDVSAVDLLLTLQSFDSTHKPFHIGFFSDMMGFATTTKPCCLAGVVNRLLISINRFALDLQWFSEEKNVDNVLQIQKVTITNVDIDKAKEVEAFFLNFIKEYSFNACFDAQPSAQALSKCYKGMSINHASKILHPDSPNWVKEQIAQSVVLAAQMMQADVPQWVREILKMEQPVQIIPENKTEAVDTNMNTQPQQADIDKAKEAETILLDFVKIVAQDAIYSEQTKNRIFDQYHKGMNLTRVGKILHPNNPNWAMEQIAQSVVLAAQTMQADAPQWAREILKMEQPVQIIPENKTEAVDTNMNTQPQQADIDKAKEAETILLDFVKIMAQDAIYSEQTKNRMFDKYHKGMNITCVGKILHPNNPNWAMEQIALATQKAAELLGSNIPQWVIDILNKKTQ